MILLFEKEFSCRDIVAVTLLYQIVLMTKPNKSNWSTSKYVLKLACCDIKM